MSIWTLYFFTTCWKVVAISKLIMIISIVAILVFLLFSVMTIDCGDDYRGVVSSWIKKLTLAATISTVLYMLTPDKEDLAIIIGGHFVTNQEEIAKLPVNVAKTLNGFLEQYQDREKQSDSN